MLLELRAEIYKEKIKAETIPSPTRIPTLTNKDKVNNFSKKKKSIS